MTGKPSHDQRMAWLVERMPTPEPMNGWLRPEPLEAKTDPPTPFPMDALLDLQSVAEGIADCTQAPPALCAVSVLAAANLAATGIADVVLWSGGVRPLNLFLISQGVSGERKSSVDRAALLGLERWEARQMAAWRRAKCVDETAPDAPSPSEPPIVRISDGTLQGIELSLVNGAPTQFFSSDEGGRFLGGYAFQKEQAQASVSALSSLWDGSRIVRKLKGAGPRSKGETVMVEGARLCMHLLAQPVILAPFLNHALTQGQGLAARILFHAPESRIGLRLETVEQFRRPLESAAVEAFAKQLEGLINRACERDLFTGNVSRKALPLNDEAAQLYVDFQNEVETRQGPGKDLHPFINLVNKIPEQAGRIGCTFAVLAGHDDVDAHCMASGIAIARYFLSETVRLAGSAPDCPKAQRAKRLAGWLSGKDKSGHLRNGASLLEILQSGPSDCRRKSTRDEAISLLTDAGWAFVSGDQRIWLNPHVANDGLLAG